MGAKDENHYSDAQRLSRKLEM